MQFIICILLNLSCSWENPVCSPSPFFIFTEVKWNSCYSLMDQNKFDWWKHDTFIATEYFPTMQNVSGTLLHFSYKVFQIEMVDYFIRNIELRVVFYFANSLESRSLTLYSKLWWRFGSLVKVVLLKISFENIHEIHFLSFLLFNLSFMISSNSDTAAHSRIWFAKFSHNFFTLHSWAPMLALSMRLWCL